LALEQQVLDDKPQMVVQAVIRFFLEILIINQFHDLFQVVLPKVALALLAIRAVAVEPLLEVLVLMVRLAQQVVVCMVVVLVEAVVLLAEQVVMVLALVVVVRLVTMALQVLVEAEPMELMLEVLQEPLVALTLAAAVVAADGLLLEVMVQMQHLAVLLVTAGLAAQAAVAVVALAVEVLQVLVALVAYLFTTKIRRNIKNDS
jgi:hypothetical protein